MGPSWTTSDRPGILVPSFYEGVGDRAGHPPPEELYPAKTVYTDLTDLPDHVIGRGESALITLFLYRKIGHLECPISTLIFVYQPFWKSSTYQASVSYEQGYLQSCLRFVW